MNKYEITFASVNSETYPKPITALVIEPDRLGPQTGLIHFAHGWGGNRYMYEQSMHWAAENLDVACVATEYRQSGFDFDPVQGHGAYRPYDASFYQVFDVLNAMRAVLALRPGLNRRRLFTYGGSQGGHIALLTTIFAPATFAFVYAASPVVHLEDPAQADWSGRIFAPCEFSVRNVLEQAPHIRCPIYLEHGTADQTLNVDNHTRRLEARLRELGKPFRVDYHEGGQHSLEPVTNRFETFKARAPEYILSCVTEQADDFAAGSRVELACADRTLQIDWSQPPASVALFRWT